MSAYHTVFGGDRLDHGVFRRNDWKEVLEQEVMFNKTALMKREAGWQWVDQSVVQYKEFCQSDTFA